MALYESGHAVVALALEPSRKVGVAIRKQFRTSSDSLARGQTRIFSLKRAGIETRESLEVATCISLGGGAAEEVLLGDRSIGSGGSKGSDLGFATAIAAQIVNSYGLGRALSFLLEDVDASKGPSRLDMASRREVDGILAEQYARAKAIVIEHRNAIEALAAELLEDERLEPNEVSRVVKRHPPEAELKDWLAELRGFQGGEPDTKAVDRQ